MRILHNVSIDVSPSETVTLLGTNGNGKSTLIKSVMGIIRPTAGRIVATIVHGEIAFNGDTAAMQNSDLIRRYYLGL